MVILGNPPYSISSSNKSDWILNLIADYKENLNERKINLDDDYIKFIRFGQHFIDKNGEGVLAYISANSFLDGITHRQMRKNLLESFDKIYVLDLHGNAKKKEVAPDGSADQNVFDIMQGVSINIFVKTKAKKSGVLSEIYQADLQGKRDFKYDYLTKNRISSIKWNKITCKEPYYFFVPKNFDATSTYEKGFKIDDLMAKYVSGFQTKRDKVTIQFSETELNKVRDIFLHSSVAEIRNTLELPEDGRDWTIDWAKKDLQNNRPKLTQVMYRPFDDRYTFLTGKSKGFVAYPRAEMFTHLNKLDNISIITCRQQSSFDFQHVFVSRLVSDMCNISSQTKETGYIFPLYLYPESGIQQTTDDSFIRKPNLNLKIVETIGKKLGLRFSEEKENNKAFAPIDILDYMYAVLHSNAYRQKYKEFLKIDFPRVPYPKEAKLFWTLVKLGGELRQIHLLESPIIDKMITQYPIEGDNIITKVKYEGGRIYINDTQYFDNVSPVAWDFYIGGYQPAQKWLKDRKERELHYDDILHYQKLIMALLHTSAIMNRIDELGVI